MNENFNVFRQDTLFPDAERRNRLSPFNHLQVGTSRAALATVSDQNAMLVKRLIACNTSVMAITLELNAIPIGGSASDANVELHGFSIASNASVDLSGLIGGLYGPGTELSAIASAAGLTLSGHFEAIF